MNMVIIQSDTIKNWAKIPEHLKNINNSTTFKIGKLTLKNVQNPLA